MSRIEKNITRTFVPSMSFFGDEWFDKDTHFNNRLESFRYRLRTSIHEEGKAEISFKRRKGFKLTDQEKDVAHRADEARFWDSFLDGDHYGMKKAFERLPIPDNSQSESPLVSQAKAIIDQFINLPLNQATLKEVEDEEAEKEMPTAAKIREGKFSITGLPLHDATRSRVRTSGYVQHRERRYSENPSEMIQIPRSTIQMNIDRIHQELERTDLGPLTRNFYESAAITFHCLIRGLTEENYDNNWRLGLGFAGLLPEEEK